MPKKTKRKPANSTAIAQWQPKPNSTFLHGVITEHVDKPYYIQIAPNGKWNLFYRGANDKPERLAEGRSRNVEAAKNDVLAAAAEHIPSLRAALALDDGEDDTEDEPATISAWHQTFRMYGAILTAVLGVPLIGYHVWLVRPKVTVLTFICIGVGIWLTDKAVKWLADADRARRQLVTRYEAGAANKRVRQPMQAPPPGIQMPPVRPSNGIVRR